MLDDIHERLRRHIAPYRVVIEESLERTFRADTVLDRAVRHVLFADAKRLRASLALIGMEAAGGTAAHALEVAVAFELLHTASLIHDDVMDGGLMRRGRPCVHRVFGAHIAITAGDALIFEAYRRLLSLGEHHPACVVAQVVEIFTACAAQACRGQARDLTFPTASATLRDYLGMIRAKTGSMIEAPLRSAGVLAAAPGLTCERLREYGRCLGMAFQIVDDALEYLGSEDRAGKTLGNDLRRGGGSALLIFSRNGSRGAERAVCDAVGRARASEDRASMTALLALFRQHGAIERTQQLCARYARRAIRELQDIDPGPARAELEAIARIVGDWDVPATR
jgi:geranylgeranyl pyrophosphate synthase